MQAALGTGSATPAPTGNVRAILRRRGFRRLLAARLASQLGDGWFQAGLAGSVFFNPERQASPVAIATAFAVLLVPYSTMGPFVGVFLDRWSRARSLVVANAARAGLVLPAAWLVWHGDEGPPFVTAALLVIALNRFFLAGVSAVAPHVVDEARLVTANSFATTSGTVLYSGGLATAALVFFFTGTGFHPYAVVAGTAALAYGFSSLLTLVSFPAPALGPPAEQRPTGSIAADIATTARDTVSGVRHLASRPAAASVMAVQAAHRGIYGVLAIATLLLFRNYYAVGTDFSGSLRGLGLVVAAGAAGSLLAAIATPPITRRIGGRSWVAAMMAGQAVLLPAAGLPFLAPLTAAGAFLIGAASQGTKIVVDTAVQVECADDFRGRVFSVNDTAYNMFFVGGLYLGAMVLPEDGRSAAVLLSVGLSYAALAAVIAASQRLRHRGLRAARSWRV